MFTKEQLDEWERLANAATPGPWAFDGLRGVYVNQVAPMRAVVQLPVGAPDCEFIAAARTAIPALIARVRELEAKRDE